ncbi:glycosyltransferase [Paenibacillus sp. GCM10027629]|uniref:glycosyltransferase n=1 Tax=Paenibacillus sp. GCM10027629 TaxID=3273414 RepID=UPI0036334166
MRTLKILVYGDVDLNIIDGSSVWLTSLCNVLNNDKNITVDVLLKSRIKNKLLLSEIEKLSQIKLIDSYDNSTNFMHFNNNRLTVKEAVNYMEEYDNKNNYHCIIIRGFDIAKEMLNSRLITKTIPYVTSFTHDPALLLDHEKEMLSTLYNSVRKMFVQTEQMKSLLVEMLGIDGAKFVELLPMIPDYGQEPEFKNINNTLVYSGKFESKWYTEEIISAYEKLHNLDNSISLNVAGNKFQGDLIKKKEILTNRLKSIEGINWVGSLSRSDAYQLINDSDLGIGWRSEEIDNDRSVELSTKLLEYGSLGKPALVRRTKMHESLLGKDYFLFAENEEEFINKSYEILNNPSLYRKTAKQIYESCRKYTFTEAYKRLKPILWSYHPEKIKLLFAGHDLKFIKMLIDYFDNDDGFEVKIDKWMGHDKHDEIFSRDCLEWADIIFCEWGLGNAVWYSNNKKKGQKLFVRMHLQERETEFPNRYCIENIDEFIAISPYIYEEFHRVCHIPRVKMKMIYNMIDTQFFNKPKRTEKTINFNIGICGILPSRKRLDRALNIFETLWNTDNRYTLYVKSKKPEELPWLMKREEERKYYNDVFDRINKAPWKKNVVFDKPGNDMDDWFQKIGFVLSTSDFESFHLAPMEGMASGSIPLVLHWVGAETIYPEEFIFNSEEEIVRYVQENNNYTTDMRENLKRYPNMNFAKELIISCIENQLLLG